MPTIVTKVISGKSATRTNYISRNNLNAALEGQGRGLYGATVNDLKRGRGTSYLRGPNHINEVFDLIISPANAELFTSLGAGAEEREANLKSAVRAGMAELESSLGLELRWLATRHQNRLHQHLHIIISEEAIQPDGTTRRLYNLPRQVFAPEANGNTALGNIFLRQFEERALRPLNAVPTRENPELMTRYPWNATLANSDGAVNFLTEEQGLMPAVVTAAAAAGTIRATEASQPVFVRRDATGLATGAVWQEPGENFARRQGSGWFYQGNLTTATRFLLVDTPEEVLALQSLHPDRDLSRVAVLALNPGRLDEELVALLVNRQRDAQAAGEETVRVVWARGHKTARQPDGSESQAQNLQGLYELNTRLQEEAAAQGLPALTLRNYAPQQAQAIPELNFAAWARPTWLATLNHLRFTAELTHYYARLRDYPLPSPAAQSTSDLQVSLEQGHLGAQPTPSRTTLPAAADIADGTRRLAAEAEALAAQRATLAAESALALAAQPALEQPTPEQEPASNAAGPDNQTRPLTWREETDALRALPLEAVALQAGYWRLQQLGEEIWTDDPAARNHSIKITGDRFYDRTLGLGGRGALNFAAHLNDFAANSKEGFSQARRWLAERFTPTTDGNFVPLTEPAEPRLELQPLLLPPPSELPANIERMRHYLEETRGLSAATVAQALENGSLYANEWGNPFFVWRDAAGQSVGGQWRSALPGDNRRDQAKGSWKEAGWFYLGDLKGASHYVLVESPLEALSYQDIALAAGHDLSATAIVSLAGTTTPPALLRLLHERQAELAAENEENPFSVALGLAAGRAGELGFNRFVAAWSAQFTGEEEFPVAVALADQPDEAQLAEAEEKPPFNPLDAVQWLAAPAGHWNAELLAERAAPHYPDLAEIATLLEDAADDPTNVTAAEFAAAAQLEVTADAREPTEALLPETPLQPPPAALPEFTPATAPVTVERNPRPAGSVPQVEAAAPDTSAWTEVKRQAVQLRPALTEAGTNTILAPAQALTWLSGRDPAGAWRAEAFGTLAASDPSAERETAFVDWSFAGGGASRHEALRGVSLELKGWLEESVTAGSPGDVYAELYRQASARLGKLAAFWRQSHERELAAAAAIIPPADEAAPPAKPLPVSAIVRQAAAGLSAQAETDAVQRGALVAGATPYAQVGERLTAGLWASRLDGIAREESKLPAALVLDAQVALLHDTPALTLSPAALAHHVGQEVQNEIAATSGETQDLIATAEADNRAEARAVAAARVEALATQWEHLEAAGPEPEASAATTHGKERQALNEATQLLLLQAGDRELYQQFFTAQADAKLPPTSAWHRGRVLAQETLARLAVKEARAAEVAFELNYERAAFALPPEVTRLAPSAFNRLSEAGQPAGEVPAGATTPVQWSLTAVKTAQETWAQARLVAETLAGEATGQQTAAKERLNQTLQTLLTPQSPAAQIRQHFLGEIPGTATGDGQLSLTQGLLNHTNPARRLEFHPLAQIAKGIYQELQAGKDAARIQAEIAAKESALAAIGEAVQTAAQAERERRSRITVQAGDKHEFVQDEADSLRVSGLSVLEDPIFVGEERELSGARALRIGDAEGVREYQLATLREAKRLDYLSKNLGGMAAALGWNPAHPPLPLDHRTAKALDDLNRMPVTPEQVAAGAVTPQTEGFLDAQINLARLRQAPQLVTEAIAARRDTLTPGAPPTLPAAVARLDGQTIVAAALTSAAQAQYQARFVARLQPRYNQPAFRVAPTIEKEVLAASRWVRPDGAPASGGDLLDRALGNGNGGLRQVSELTRWAEVAQNNPMLAAVARERMTQLENLADHRQQGFVNTQQALVQLRGEVELTTAIPPLLTAGDLATGLTASAHLPYNDPHGAGEPYREWQKQTASAQVQDLTPGPRLLADGADLEAKKDLDRNRILEEAVGERLELDERQLDQAETAPTTVAATPTAEVVATGRRVKTGLEMVM